MRIYLPWLLALFAFPIGGGLALLFPGPVTSLKSGAVAGLIAGLALGLAQWLALRGIIPGIRSYWIFATALGCSLGTALGQGIGQGTGYAVVFYRSLAAGLLIGSAQYLSWRAEVPHSTLWIPVVGVAWALAWITTKSVGVDLSKGYAVFGASGALMFQGLTGTALYLLLRPR
jgi:hypothetical protein